MKTYLTLLIAFWIHYSHAQTFVSFAGGTSTKRDAALHAAIGYQYRILSIEAGFIGAPINTDRPAFLTSLLTIDLPINDNWKILPLAGVGIKTMSPGKFNEGKTDAYLGARLQFKDGFIEAAHSDKTYFFSIGLKGYLRERE